MLYMPPPEPLPFFHQSTYRSDSAPKRGAYDQDWFDDSLDVTRRVIPRRLDVGQTSYPLRSALVGFFYPGNQGTEGEFVVPEFGNKFVGLGQNPDSAYLDWRDQVHRRFQELYAMRPFEMSEPEKAAWRVLEDQIDVSLYRNAIPLTVRQVGIVGNRMRPHPERIAWEDGTVETVSLEQMPAEFAGYRPGQPFEAVVARDPLDFHLQKVIHIRRISKRKQSSVAEFQNLIDSIPTSKDMPVVGWD